MRRVKLRYVALGAVLGVMLFMNYVVPMIPGLRGLGTRVMVVASGSMRPFLNVGDIVVFRGVEPEEVEVGDVIAFVVAPRFQRQYNYPPVIAHRVVEVIRVGSDLYFQTKGDATENDPFTVPARDVIGIYDWKIPYAGLPLAFLQSRYGMALLASYAIIDLALTYVPVWWRKRKEREKVATAILQEISGIRESLASLAVSTRGATSGVGILLKRKPGGVVEVAEASKPNGLTVKRRLTR